MSLQVAGLSHRFGVDPPRVLGFKPSKDMCRTRDPSLMAGVEKPRIDALLHLTSSDFI